VRVFIDTSVLFKKYVAEPGSDAFERVLAKATEIAVSPVTRIEMDAAIERRLRDRTLSQEQAEWLRAEAGRDFAYFLQVVWNQNLERKAIELVSRYALRTLDAVQLASGVLSEAKLFVTSDRKLYTEARRVVRRALCV
jgi:predicted nucleic acid-binding protein